MQGLAGQTESAGRLLELPSVGLRDRVQSEMAARGLSQVTMARELGVARPTLNRWLNGQSVGPQVADLLERVESWLVEQDSPPCSSTVESDGFIETPSAERITSTLAYAQASGDMVCIYGGPGVGKTTAIRHYAAQYDHVWVVTMDPATSAVVAALEELAEAVGIQEAHSGARRLSRAIRAQVRDRRGLIIVDEAQHLSMAAIEQLRSIHDATGCGLALCGNEQMYGRLTGGSRNASFAQVFSRLGMRLYLGRPESSDVAAMAARHRCRDAKAVALLERVAGRPGALRTVHKILRLASATPGAVDYDRVRTASDNLGADE